MISTFRRAVTLVVVLSLVHNVLKAENINVEVAPHGWGGADLENIEKLLVSAAQQFPYRSVGPALPPIYIFYSTESPIILKERSKHHKVQIGLATGGTYWAQYTFQFSHEFVHLLIRYMDPSLEEQATSRPATWLEESLCEVGSLFALRSMARQWKVKAPYPNWKSYADALWNYAENRITNSEEALLGKESFGQWFRNQEQGLKNDAGNREANTLIATRMLPLFERTPQMWELLRYYSSAAISSSDTASEKFAKWAEACPPHLRTYVRRLAALFS